MALSIKPLAIGCLLDVADFGTTFGLPGDVVWGLIYAFNRTKSDSTDLADLDENTELFDQLSQEYCENCGRPMVL